MYRAESRVLCRSAIDLGASPAAIAEMAADAGVANVRVRVHYHWSGAVAAARPATRSLHFSTAALTVPLALHEIAHLQAGSKAQHGERFVVAFVRLVTHVGGAELAMRFQATLREEGAGLWDPVPHRLSVA